MQTNFNASAKTFSFNVSNVLQTLNKNGNTIIRVIVDPTNTNEPLPIFHNDFGSFTKAIQGQIAHRYNVQGDFFFMGNTSFTCFADYVKTGYRGGDERSENDYVKGGEMFRDLVESRKVDHKDVVIAGRYYRLMVRGDRVSAHLCNSKFDPASNNNHDYHAHALLTAWTTISKFIENGQNFDLYYFDQQAWLADAFMADVAGGTDKARQTIMEVNMQGEQAAHVERLVVASTNKEKYVAYGTKNAQLTLKDGVTVVPHTALVGKNYVQYNKITGRKSTLGQLPDYCATAEQAYNIAIASKNFTFEILADVVAPAPQS